MYMLIEEQFYFFFQRLVEAGSKFCVRFLLVIVYCLLTRLMSLIFIRGADLSPYCFRVRSRNYKKKKFHPTFFGVRPNIIVRQACWLGVIDLYQRKVNSCYSYWYRYLFQLLRRRMKFAIVQRWISRPRKTSNTTYRCHLIVVVVALCLVGVSDIGWCGTKQ